MKKNLLTIFLFWLFGFDCGAQKYWTGLGTAGQWSSAANWSGGTVPTSSDDVILNNLNVGGSYLVILPNTAVSIKTIKISPAAANIITLLLPNTNTLHPALIFTGPGNVLTIDNGGVFKNSSGATASTPADVITISTSDTIRINNGGKYIHNNLRSHAYLISQLSLSPGTEKGIFKFDVPGTGGYTLSLTGNKYGTIELNADSSGGTKTYSGNGVSDLIIRGHLWVNSGVNFNSSMTANIYIAGDVLLNGSFDNNPSSGATARSLIFNGIANQTISGSGPLSFGTFFRNAEVNPNAIVTLARDITLANPGNTLLVNSAGTLHFGIYKVSGAGRFMNSSLSYLSFGDANGITLAPGVVGNVQTGTRTFNVAGNYEYNGSAAQVTGNALPANIAQLVINNPNGLSLTNTTMIRDSLSLNSGKLLTGATALILSPVAKVRSGPSSYFNLAGAYPNNMGTATSYVVGNIVKQGLSNQTFAFPTGNFIHRPIILKNATGDFNVKYVEQNPYTNIANGGIMDGVLNHVSSIEYWTINSSNGTASVELTFYDPNSGGVTQMSSLRVAQHDGSRWNNKGNGSTLGTPGANGSVTSSAPVFINSISPFTLASVTAQNPLPVKLISFAATSKDYSAQLSWITEGDSSVEKYIIERSYDGVSFNEVKSVVSLNQQSQFNYIAFDNFPSRGWNYYRLKIIENDKTYYSKTVSVWFVRSKEYLVYPSPAYKEINITNPDQSSVTFIKIVNTSGQIVKTIESAASLVTINIESLDKGMYFIHFLNQRSAIVQRFFKR